VKVNAAPAEGTAAAGADLAAEAELAAWDGPEAGDAAEHPASAAAIHKNPAQMAGPFLSIWRRLA
jgi:hypothetical protein